MPDNSNITPKGYKPRLIENRLDALLSAFGAVEIIGPKWCGKTWTGLSRSKSVTELDRPAEREAALMDPSLALVGEAPHLVDEWQEVPEVWDATRRFVDDAGHEKGLVILTGSTALRQQDRPRRRHSGAGRIARLHMRPMSLAELGASTKSVSLQALFEGESFAPTRCETTLQEVAHWCCQGGWPGAINLPANAAQEIPGQYLQAFLEDNVIDEGKDITTTRQLLKALAVNASRSVTYKTILKDMDPQGRDHQIAHTTLVSYLDMLERMYLVEGLEGWCPAMRDKARVRTKPKYYFCDPSLPAALLGATPERLLKDMQTLGDLFENLCIRDLRVYISTFGKIDDRVMYYRDEKGLEVDAVIEHDDKWAALEIKLSETKIDEGAANLLKLKSKLTENPKARVQDPAFLAVITGKSTLSYQRADGVYVIPIAALTV